MPTNSLRHTAALALSTFAASLSAHAGLLVYEGFNGYTSGALAGQHANANTVGLDTSSVYYDGATPSRAGYVTLTSGLTFSGLATSGGALSFTAPSTSNGVNVIGSDIDIGTTAYTGTLWSSYLINISSSGAAAGDGIVTRIGATPSDSNAAHFNAWADARVSTTASKQVSVGYGSTALAASNGTAALSLDTTYIIISRFTNVGTTLSTGNPGVATLWALTEAQYEAFLLAGGDETALNTTSVTATASSTSTSGVYTFSSSTAFAFVTVNASGTYDELRYGSTLADVTPTAVPEPASLASLLGLGVVVFVFGRRKRR